MTETAWLGEDNCCELLLDGTVCNEPCSRSTGFCLEHLRDVVGDALVRLTLAGRVAYVGDDPETGSPMFRPAAR